MTELKQNLQRLDFWEHLSDEEKKRVEDFAVIREYQAGNILHAMEGDCLGLVVVLEGSVRAYMMSEEGREITLYHIRAGEWDVLTASCIMYQVTFDTQMVIEHNSRILIVPTTVLAGLKQNNVYVRSFIYETLTERFSDVMWTIQQILFYGIDQRVAAFLLNHAEQPAAGRASADRNSARTASRTSSAGRNSSAGAGEIPNAGAQVRATHEQIAREINTAREVVARIIKRFADDGIVETARGRIIITDPDRLLEMTEEQLLTK